jgi:protein phosphatase
MICSDGLSPVVGAEAIQDVLVSAVDPGHAVRELVGLAEDAGGPDNISVIVVDARETEGKPAAPVTLGAASAVLTG